ncbi:unnamed protein product [Linum tenue]|uniref:Uncharacterized protein n=2 Tax=Linum tenue TaxID=586396 RepID=A0AAV0J2J1_9ROSI|nr:unnamed protein product [Linum tenue]
MGCKINALNPPMVFKSSTLRPSFRITAVSSFASSSPKQQASTRTTKLPNSDAYSISFKTLEACKLGISRYPDFDYNAKGGTGTGIGTKDGDHISVSFDLQNLYIPPLTSETTRILGLPLPPGLKIDIVPESFQGRIAPDSGKVELEFVANFWFSAGSFYRAPPLLVKTVLTSEESRGSIRNGVGERLDKVGKCRLVGVASVDPIDDVFMNTFLSLPTECLAILNAVISISE